MHEGHILWILSIDCGPRVAAPLWESRNAIGKRGFMEYGQQLIFCHGLSTFFYKACSLLSPTSCPLRMWHSHVNTRLIYVTSSEHDTYCIRPAERRSDLSELLYLSAKNTSLIHIPSGKHLVSYMVTLYYIDFVLVCLKSEKKQLLIIH